VSTILSLHDPQRFDEYAGDAAQWAMSEAALAEALDALYRERRSLGAL